MLMINELYTEAVKTVIDNTLTIREYKYDIEGDGIFIYYLGTYITNAEISTIRGGVYASSLSFYGLRAGENGLIYIEDEELLLDNLYRYGTVTRTLHQSFNSLVKHQSHLR